MITFYDMFHGIGGFRLGLESVGMKCVGGCEWNEYARTIYEKHWPDGISGLDATKIRAEDVPDCDIITAGFPCQAFSSAGKRLGFEESRGTLFFEIARIAKQKRPRILLLENVTGLLSHDSGRTFAEILATLDEIGYDAEWQVLNSKYYVPQNRDRIFIVGHLRERPTGQIFPIQGGDIINDSTHKKTQGGGPRLRGQRSGAITSSYYKGWGGGRTIIKVLDSEFQNDRVHDTKGISPTIPTAAGGQHIPLIKVGNTCKTHPNSQTGIIYDEDGIGPTIQAGSHGYAIGHVREKKERLFMLAHTKANIKQREQERDVSWTVDTAGSKQGIQESDRIRRFTPLECERLQGFPDNWTEGLSDTQRYKCIGNAVTVPVIEEIGRALVQCMSTSG